MARKRKKFPSNLRKLSSKKLVSLDQSLAREEREAFHAKARENVLNPQAHGPIPRDDRLLRLRKQVEQEAERRYFSKRGDRTLDSIGAKKFKADFRGLPDRALVDDLLKTVSPLPVPIPLAPAADVHIKAVAEIDLPKIPGNLGSLSNKELERLTDEVERRIALFMEFYSNLDGVQSQWAR